MDKTKDVLVPMNPQQYEYWKKGLNKVETELNNEISQLSIENNRLEYLLKQKQEEFYNSLELLKEENKTIDIHVKVLDERSYYHKEFFPPMHIRTQISFEELYKKLQRKNHYDPLRYDLNEVILGDRNYHLTEKINDWIKDNIKNFNKLVRPILEKNEILIVELNKIPKFIRKLFKVDYE
jgi:hypothetical protein